VEPFKAKAFRGKGGGKAFAEGLLARLKVRRRGFD
jgi:hypothetical protein